MDDTKRLQTAIVQQFQWVKVLTGQVTLHTRNERYQAYLFAAMHASFILILFGHSLWTILSISLTLALQVIAFMVSLMLYVTVMEYADKMSNAMELEQTQNPLMVATISVRCFCLFHAFLIHCNYLFAFGLLEIGYNYKMYKERTLLIDATTVWKEVKVLKKDRTIRMAFNAVMLLVAIFNVLLRILRLD